MRWTYCAVRQESANARPKNPATSSCSIATNHVNSTRSGKIYGSDLDEESVVGSWGVRPEGIRKQVLGASVDTTDRTY